MNETAPAAAPYRASPAMKRKRSHDEIALFSRFSRVIFPRLRHSFVDERFTGLKSGLRNARQVRRQQFTRIRLHRMYVFNNLIYNLI